MICAQNCWSLIFPLLISRMFTIRIFNVPSKLERQTLSYKEETEFKNLQTKPESCYCLHNLYIIKVWFFSNFIMLYFVLLQRYKNGSYLSAHKLKKTRVKLRVNNMNYDFCRLLVTWLQTFQVLWNIQNAQNLYTWVLKKIIYFWNCVKDLWWKR